MENSTRAEQDRLWLTALRARVDVEPYGSGDLGGDPSDDEPPSMTCASLSEDDVPEDPENPSRKKMKRKRKTKRPDGRTSQEAKAIATSKSVVNLPEFTRKDLSEFAENFGRFLRILGGSSCRVKNDRKGRKMTGFKKHQIIIILMDISGPSRTSTVKEKMFQE